MPISSISKTTKHILMKFDKGESILKVIEFILVSQSNIMPTLHALQTKLYSSSKTGLHIKTFGKENKIQVSLNSAILCKTSFDEMQRK